jgi:3-dehydroquinate synthase
MKHTIHVDLDARGYDIHVGTDLPAETLELSADGERALIVSDANVDPLYGDAVAALLEARGFMPARAVVPAGEKTKNMRHVAALYADCVAAGLDRRAVVVALGGGMVGDLAGFVAATFLRGVRLVQVPTSLLAMVDSSVGGKTGVNLKSGKNLVGAFYQPVTVLADLRRLESLPEREFRSGLAEVVKYGVIWDAELFRTLEREADAIGRRDFGVLEPIVARCCEIKAEVVAVDERESGVRSILNFGHTLGHGIEQVSGYGGRWLHGEAVSLGMVYAAALSTAARGFATDDRDRLRALLSALGLPVHPGAEGFEGGWTALRDAMNTDKKTRGRVPRFVLAERIGAVVFDCVVDETVLREAFSAAFADSN